MNSEQRRQNEESIGYLVVRVSTARGAIPLENASVTIRGGAPEASGIIYSMRTNQDGLTEKTALPTPALYLSEAPGNPAPYSTWNIDVFKDGYTPLFFHNVPIFAGVTSVQPAVMVPTGVGEIHVDESYAPSAKTRQGESEGDV